MNWPYHILCKYFCLLLFLGAGHGLFAQQGQNPFEIPNRPTNPTTNTEASNPEEETPQANNNPFDIQGSSAPTPNASPEIIETPPVVDTNSNQNPFDLQKNASPQVSPPPAPDFKTGENPFEIKRLDTRAKPGVKKVAPSPVLQPQKNSTSINDRSFLSIVAGILIIISTVLIVLYRSVVSQIYRAFLNDNILKLKQREQGSFLHLSLIALYFLFFLNAGFFCYLIAKNFGPPIQDQWQTLAFCTLGVSGIFMLKHLFLRLLGVIFPISKELRQYSFTIVVFNITIGLLLLPLNLLTALGPSGSSKYLIYSTLGIIALIYCFRFMRSLLIASRHISLNKFHFFMYLCTVEIAPTLVLVKLLLMIQG